MDLIAELQQLLAEFERRGVEYALCGGLALAVHGLPRFTKDVDLLMPEASVAGAVAAAVAVGYDNHVDSLRMPAVAGEATEIRRLNKFVGTKFLTLDLLLVSPAIAEAWNTRQVFDFEGQNLWCVSRSGLVKLKQYAGRDQDVVDLKRLEQSDST